jgi:signal recognition particle subunit SRP54
MVLEELGGRISTALRSLGTSKHVDKAAFDAVLKEITNALAQSDVEIPLVMQVRANILKKVNIVDMPAGIDKRAVIERAVRDELCSLLDGTGDRKVPRPKRGKPFVVMFVGLQVWPLFACMPCMPCVPSALGAPDGS